MTEVKKTWQEMSKEERDTMTRERKLAAVEAVKAGHAKPAIRVKIGEHTLYAKPSGMSEKGNVSYSIAPVKIDVGGHDVRINRLSLTLLGSGNTAIEDVEFTDEDCL